MNNKCLGKEKLGKHIWEGGWREFTGYIKVNKILTEALLWNVTNDEKWLE